MGVHATGIRILAVDQNSLLREGLSLLIRLQSDMELVDAVASAEEGVQSFIRNRPDVILMDIDLPLAAGVGAIRRILEIEPAHRLVYTVVRGVPVRNYRAEVVLDPLDSGTAIRWIATWDRTILGRIVHRRLATFYPEMVNQLVASADAATATGGGGA